MKKYIGVIPLLIVIGLIVWFSNKKEKKNDSSPNESLLRHRLKIYELALSQSSRERMVYIHRSDSINRVNTTLIRMSNKYDSLLSKVKGSYNKLNNNELEKEMIKRYNASK